MNKLIGVLQQSATKLTTIKLKTAVPIPKLNIEIICENFRAPAYIGCRGNVGSSQEVDSYCNEELIFTTYNTGVGS
jgi:hypothetical protein